MGRPSLAEQRKAEILDAFGRCVAKYGLAGSSLEKIAEEAGMRRSILRHYIGNRDDLVDALAKKVISDYRTETERLFDLLPARNRDAALINVLLPTNAIGSTEQLLIIEGLIGASQQYPAVRKLVFEYVDGFVDLIARQLHQIKPDVGPAACWDTAYALTCLSFNQESLQPLTLPPKYLRAARRSARNLIRNLG